MSTKIITVAAIAAAAFVVSPLRGQEACQGLLLSQKDVNVIVQQFETKYTSAFNRGDVKELASLYTDNAAVTTQAGTLLVGRSSIEDALACSLAAASGRMENTAAYSAVISSEVIVTQGKSRMLLPNAEDTSAATVYTQVLARQGDQWRLAAVQYSRPAVAQAVSGSNSAGKQ